MRAVVFAGPTLPPRNRSSEPMVEWLPPVRQGDLYRVARTRPAIIGIIDGYFEVTPTVWHKEILWAMAEGIHVFGAASIGALRAAELDVFGMRGFGDIYEAYRDGTLTDDDEVAMLHGPAELGYPPVTEAMVNIRVTFDAALRQGIIDAALAAELTDIGKTLFYKERTFAEIFDAAASRGAAARELARLTDWLPTGRVDQKRLDALDMLAAICKSAASEEGRLQVDYKLADTAAWKAAKRRVDEGG